MKYFFYSSLLAFFLVGCGGGSAPNTIPVQNDPGEITYQPPVGDIHDTYYEYQWELHETSTLPWVNPNASSNVEEAWNRSNGTGVIIAIIDSSFDINHEDLNGNILYTYNVADGSTNVNAVSGEDTHGTSVFGIIGAQKNNKGIIGVAYNAKYILIKMDNTMQGLIDAFHYAENHGAQIINNSWGTYDMNDITYDLIEEAYNKNIKVVFASGNDNTSLDDPSINDECEHPHVICVGSSNENSERSSYSNYGSALDIVAPSGEYGIVTTDATGTAGYNMDQANTLKNNNYTYFSGTSASAPIVTGIVGLMLQNEPSLTLEDIFYKFQYYSDKIGSESYVNDRNDYYGYGRINAGKIVE